MSSIPGKVIAAATVLALILLGGAGVWLHAAYPIVFSGVVITVFVALALGAAGGAVLGLLYLFNTARWKAFTARHTADLTRAQVQIAPLAQNLHMHHENHMLPASDLPALPAPPPDVVQPLDRWLEWADAQPHILLGGRTKAGKTTTATAILARRLARRETVFIIDPHASDWLGLPTAGRISQDGELSRALEAVLVEYIQRMVAREDYKARTGHELPSAHFGRMTVLIDECNAIADLLPVKWATFTKQIASGSRKVGISLLLLAQSPLVEDLKISGAMRENFARLALDDRTVQQLIDTCRDKDRKAALNTALVGLDYPAAATIGAQVWLLERDGLDRILEPADSHVLVWNGWNYAAGDAEKGARISCTPVAEGATQQLSRKASATASNASNELLTTPDLPEVVARLRQQGMAKTRIIELLWGVKAGGNERYRLASEDYEKIVREVQP